MSAADEIAKFHELLLSGAINEAEFAKVKASILKGTPAPLVSKGFAPQTQPIKSNVQNAAPRIQNGSSPLQMGASVAAGYVAGQFLKDKLLNNDDTANIIDHSLISGNDVISASFVEMPSGDVFYEVSETVTYEGTLSENEVQQINDDFDSDDSGGFFDFS